MLGLLALAGLATGDSFGPRTNASVKYHPEEDASPYVRYTDDTGGDFTSCKGVTPYELNHDFTPGNTDGNTITKACVKACNDDDTCTFFVIATSTFTCSRANAADSTECDHESDSHQGTVILYGPAPSEGSSDSSGVSTGGIIGIVLGATALVAGVVYFANKRLRRKAITGDTAASLVM